MHPSEPEREFKPLAVTSTAFSNGSVIPSRYTCEGEDINPPIEISEIPEDVKSLALIVDDPDAPGGTWLHWLVWNIPVIRHVKEDHAPGTQGLNDFGRTRYGGPCPPSGTHRYFFRVYGLDEPLNLKPGATRHELEQIMGNHVLAYGELIGLYKRSRP